MIGGQEVEQGGDELVGVERRPVLGPGRELLGGAGLDDELVATGLHGRGGGLSCTEVAVHEGDGTNRRTETAGVALTRRGRSFNASNKEQ